MRYLVAAGLSALLVLALAVSITTGGGGVDRPQDRPLGIWCGPRPTVPIPGPHWLSDRLALDDVGLVVKRALVAGAEDALLRYDIGRHHLAVQPVLTAANRPEWREGPVIYAGPPGRIADLAVEAYDVAWARDILEAVEMCESSRQVQPCKVGNAGELGPFQFMPSTWATMPYALGDPCDRVTAWHAAAWFVSVGRWGEWTCWGR